MSFQKCIQFANENPICFLATVDNAIPHVRAMGLWFADVSGFYFQTTSCKDLSRQLMENPRVEVCFFKREGLNGTMMRIAGEVKILHEKAKVDRVLKDRPYLYEMKLADEKSLVLFSIEHGEAHFWDLENNLKSKNVICF